MIVGNKIFSEEELKKVFKLRPRTWLSIFRTNTPYSKENLRGDLESLESFYKNRGYLNFYVNNSIITISEKKQELFIRNRFNILKTTPPKGKIGNDRIIKLLVRAYQAY